MQIRLQLFFRLDLRLSDLIIKRSLTPFHFRSKADPADSMAGLYEINEIINILILFSDWIY